MLENFLAGSAALFGDPFTIGIFVFGVIGGMLFGAIPGVSMLTLAAILLPFTAGLEPAQGVMLFAVIYCTGTYGGAITAILFNIPGVPENAPTQRHQLQSTKQPRPPLCRIRLSVSWGSHQRPSARSQVRREC